MSDTIEKRLIHKQCQDFLDNFGWKITHIRFNLYGDTVNDHQSFSCIAVREGETKHLYCCIGEDHIYGTTETMPGIGCYRIENNIQVTDPEYVKNSMPAFQEVFCHGNQ